MRIVVEPDPPALYVVYDDARRVAQFETREAAEAYVAPPEVGTIVRSFLGSRPHVVVAVDERSVWIKRADEPKKNRTRRGAQEVGRFEFARDWTVVS